MKVIFNKKDHIGLEIDSHAMAILAVTPTHPKGTIRSKKRLVRIRLNLVRELKALNKEIRRHKITNPITG